MLNVMALPTHYDRAKKRCLRIVWPCALRLSGYNFLEHLIASKYIHQSASTQIHLSQGTTYSYWHTKFNTNTRYDIRALSSGIILDFAVDRLCNYSTNDPDKAMINHCWRTTVNTIMNSSCSLISTRWYEAKKEEYCNRSLRAQRRS